VPSSEHAARELLTIALHRAGMALNEVDHARLAGELAQLLDEGRIIAAAVPASLEPLTVAAFGEVADEA
jgi:hypothetical protein